MHCGGSPEALTLIKENNIFDLNEFYNGQYYWRDGSRSAPHNVYTSSELWNKAFVNQESGIRNQGERTGWKFDTSTAQQHLSTSAPSDNVTIKQYNNITISFLPPVYEAVWKYNSSTNQYARYQMAKPHCDLKGECIVADTIIIQKVKTEVLDEVGRLGMETLGRGEAYVLMNGGIIKGYWQKPNQSGRTKFYAENGEEITLNPGKIWVEVVNQTGSVKME
jgi:hypothetical protein